MTRSLVPIVTVYSVCKKTLNNKDFEPMVEGKKNSKVCSLTMIHNIVLNKVDLFFNNVETLDLKNLPEDSCDIYTYRVKCRVTLGIGDSQNII